MKRIVLFILVCALVPVSLLLLNMNQSSQWPAGSLPLNGSTFTEIQAQHAFEQAQKALGACEAEDDVVNEQELESLEFYTALVRHADCVKEYIEDYSSPAFREWSLGHYLNDATDEELLMASHHATGRAMSSIPLEILLEDTLDRIAMETFEEALEAELAPMKPLEVLLETKNFQDFFEQAIEICENQGDSINGSFEGCVYAAIFSVGYISHAEECLDERVYPFIEGRVLTDEQVEENAQATYTCTYRTIKRAFDAGKKLKRS